MAQSDIGNLRNVTPKAVLVKSGNVLVISGNVLASKTASVAK